MKRASIKVKVLVALAACLCAGVAGTVALMHYSFESNARALGTESVNRSARLFEVLEAREISKMTAVSALIADNPEILQGYQEKNRDKLLEHAAPIYRTLQEQGITNWMFHTSEPDMRVFLRVHNPGKYGDQLNRFLTKEVARTHGVVTGNELARAGFAVRVLRPFFDARGNVAGYVEFGEELGQFMHAMSAQTNDQYGLLLSKRYLDRQFWADSSAMWKRRDNWDDNAAFVVADKTTESDRLIQFDGNLASIPKDGELLERFQQGDKVYVRGVFPIQDAAGNTVGAMFVVRDISEFYLSMKHTQRLLLAVTVVVLALSTVLILAMLQSLVFRRLDNIVVVATRVVGGDYKTEIRPSAEDEIGQFETLFEQFRRVFVDVLEQIPELQEK